MTTETGEVVGARVTDAMVRTQPSLGEMTITQEESLRRTGEEAIDHMFHTLNLPASMMADTARAAAQDHLDTVAMTLAHIDVAAPARDGHMKPGQLWIFPGVMEARFQMFSSCYCRKSSPISSAGFNVRSLTSVFASM